MRYLVTIVVVLMPLMSKAQFQGTYMPENGYLYLKLCKDRFKYYPSYSQEQVLVVRGRYKKTNDTIILYGNNHAINYTNHEESFDISLEDSIKIIVITEKNIPPITYVRINQRKVDFNPHEYSLKNVDGSHDTLKLILPQAHIVPVRYILLATALNNYKPVVIDNPKSNRIVIYIDNKKRKKRPYYVYDNQFIVSSDTLFRVDCNLDTCNHFPFIKTESKPH